MADRPEQGRPDHGRSDDAHTPAEIAAAEALDAQIDATLAGRGRAVDDPVVSWLALAMRTDPPGSLAQRVALDRARLDTARLRPLRVGLGFMAYLFVSHGFGNIFMGDWIGSNVGDSPAPHGYFEGGLALLAVGILVLGALFRRSWMPAAVSAGVPLGLAFGGLGVAEAGTFGFGAVMHLTQAAVAVFVGITWWKLRRYGRAPTDEDGA